MLKIRDWDKHFENNRTREMKRMDWVPIPNRMDGIGYTELIDHPNGAAHLGAWLAIVEIASRRDIRGTLPPDGTRTLSRISRIPASVFNEVIPRLIEIQWLEQVEEIPQEPAEMVGTTPQEGAEVGVGTPQEGAALRARVPFPSVPSPSLPFSSVPARVEIEKLPTWKKDEAFARFATDYLATGAALIDADFSEAFEFCWKTLDFGQRMERVAAMNRHAEEYHANPRYVPKPLKFLQTEWERPVRPPPAVEPHRNDVRRQEIINGLYAIDRLKGRL